MCRTFVESNSGSYAGRIAPPGMPNTTSAPTSSSERTSDCAPVTALLLSVIAADPSAGRMAGFGQQKTPRAARALRGGASTGLVDALGKYEGKAGAHGSER